MIKYILPLGFLFLLSACITDEKVTTQFHPNGTVRRVVTFKTDKKNFDFSDLCTPVDSAWSITMQRDTADTTVYNVRMEKEFSDVRRMNNDYKNIPNALSGVKREISFDKKFMWFYTFYYYQETIYQVFDEYPMSDFMTEEEMRYFMAGDDQRKEMLAGRDSIEQKKFDNKVGDRSVRWIASCMFREFFVGLKQVVQKYPEGSFTKDSLLSGKDTLMKEYVTAFADLGNDKNNFQAWFMQRYGLDPDTIINHYPASFTKYVTLQNILSSAIGKEYENLTELPGRVYDSNADKTNGKLLSWQIRPARFLGDDLDMFAASRQANLWAWIIAAGLLLLTLGVWLVPRKREK